MCSKYVKYTNSKKADWDNFIAAAKNATFLFQREFMDYHNDRFEDFSLMIYKDENYMLFFPQIKMAKMFIHIKGLPMAVLFYRILLN